MVGCPADHDAMHMRALLAVLQGGRCFVAVLDDPIEAELQLWEIPPQGPDPPPPARRSTRMDRVWCGALQGAFRSQLLAGSGLVWQERRLDTVATQ